MTSGLSLLRRARWRPVARGPALALLLFAGACTASGEEVADWPPDIPEVAITLDEYDIGLERQVPAGRVELRFENVGSEAHHAMLVPLPEDLPPIDEQLAGDERREVSVLASITPRQPGEQGAFAVDLEEGRRYGLVCFVEDDDGELHAHRGMTAEFRAGGPDAEPSDEGPSPMPTPSP